MYDNMGRYDFLDEELKKKLEEKQKELITDRKKEEVKQSKDKKKDKEESGPSVYTKEDGSIGGVIYPEGEDKPKKESESAADAILGSEEEESKDNPGKEEDEDLPVKLHHTKETKVGSEDRPEPNNTENPTTKLPEEKEEKKEKNNEDVDGARESIWQ